MATTLKAKRPNSNTPAPISQDAQQSFVAYVNEATRLLGSAYNMRARMQEIDRIYQREVDYTTTQRRAQAANKGGNVAAMQNVTLPVVMPQVESHLTELTEIFLSSYPIFPVFSKPDMQDAALQMETTIGEQGVQFAWGAELTQCMRDGLKYNLIACEVAWEEKKVYAVGNDASTDVKQGVATETLFAGNSVKRLDPYNVILDQRVPPFQVHTRGEYAGYTEMVSRIELKQQISEMDPTRTMNAKAAFESGNGEFTTSSSSNAYFVPQVNPNSLVDTTNIQGPGNSINWFAWAGLEHSTAIRYADIYEKTVLYARILPSEHKIFGSSSNTPQIWKMIVINRKVCIFAERQTNAHNYLPIVVAQATEDGLSWQSKSFADNAAPFQALATSLYTSGLESQRRKVYDRIFYDPSRINKADIDNTSVVARIPIKNEAYGKPVSEAVYAMPYRDDNVNQVFSTAEQVLNMADIANGQNRVQRGQFQKGNKTRSEYQDTMENSNARPRLTARVLEDRFFTPIKTILKLNTLQFQPPAEMYNRNTKQNVKIDPVMLRKSALEFRMADGLMPTDALMNMELFQAILQLAGQFPPLLQNWDIMGMIFYWLKLEGATWVDDFRLQAPAPQAVPTQPGMPPQPTLPPQ